MSDAKKKNAQYCKVEITVEDVVEEEDSQKKKGHEYQKRAREEF